MPLGQLAFLGAARFQGYWDATTNAATGSGVQDAPSGEISVLFNTSSSPASGYHESINLTASLGDYWQVTGSGVASVNGYNSWELNDWIIYSGSAEGNRGWIKMSFKDTITSVVFGDLSSSSFHMGQTNDKQLIFASGSVFSGSSGLSYNYDTNIVTLPEVAFSSDLRILDDKKIYFGTENESYIEYNENLDDFLVISGSTKGIVLSGSTVQIAGTLEGASPLKIGGEIQFTSAGEEAAFNFGPNNESKIYYRDGAEGMLVISGSDGHGVVISGSHVIVDTNLGIGLTGDNVTHAITLPNDNSTAGAIKANSFISYSSVRYKDDIEILDDPMSVIQKINGVSFKWKDSGKQDYGFIAEDVGQVLPEIVSWENNEKYAHGLEYTKLISFLVEAAKKQKKEIDLLNHELENMSNSFNKKITLLLSSTAFLVFLLSL